jgi:fructose-1,6-bisphosphatase/inositol monophosphatase family enzyme
LSLDAAVEALMRRVAEQAILPHYRTLTEGQIFAKAADDVVTVADNLSEQLLAEGLAQIMPGLPIVGEEAAHADPSVQDRLSGDCWIVDPLDGTRNFAKGQPPFGILIAMASGGIAHAGWIYDVLTGRLCVAHQGKGASVDGQRITARTTGEVQPVAAISMLFMDQAKRAVMLEHIAPHYTLVDVPYCAAEQYPRLALGTNDVSIFERTLAWDHAAGVLWLNEAGGKATRPDGSPYRVDEWARKGLVGAANPALWEQMVRRLEVLG